MKQLRISSPKSLSSAINCAYNSSSRSLVKLRLKSKWLQLKYCYYFHRSKLRWEDLIESWFVITMVLMAVAFNLLFIATWITKTPFTENISNNPLLSDVSNPSQLQFVNPSFPSVLDLCTQVNQLGSQNKQIFAFCQCSQSQSNLDFNMEYDLGLQCSWLDISSINSSFTPIDSSTNVARSFNLPARPFAKFIQNKLQGQYTVKSLYFQAPNKIKSLTSASNLRSANLQFFDKYNIVEHDTIAMDQATSSDEKRILIDCAYLSLVCALFQFMLGMCRNAVLEWIIQLRVTDEQKVSRIMQQWTDCTLLMHKKRVQQCIDTVERISETLSTPSSARTNSNSFDCMSDDNDDSQTDKETQMHNEKPTLKRRRSSLTPTAIIAALRSALMTQSKSPNWNKEKMFNFDDDGLSQKSIMLPRDIERMIVDFTWKRKFDSSHYIEIINHTQRGKMFKYFSQGLIYSQLGIITSIILMVFVGFQWFLRIYADDAFVFVIACQVPVIWCFVTTFLLPELVSG